MDHDQSLLIMNVDYKPVAGCALYPPGNSGALLCSVSWMLVGKISGLSGVEHSIVLENNTYSSEDGHESASRGFSSHPARLLLIDGQSG